MLPDEQVRLDGELGSLWGDAWSASARRRAIAARRLRIYFEDHAPLVLQTIDERMNNSEIADYVKRFVSRSPCLLRAVTDQVAVTYSRGCTRELQALKLGEEKAQAFADIVAESGISRKANGLNARSWLTPVLVSPHLDRRNRLAIDMIGADRYTATLYDNAVDAAVWQEGKTFISVDDQRWTYFDERGAVTRTVEHFVGATPAIHTTAIDNTVDPWITTAHDGLADATLDVAYMYAWGRYVRQVGSVPQLFIIAPIDTLLGSAGQSLGHPALPITIKSETPAEVRVEMLDRTVLAADGLAEIAATITMAISAEGIPPGSVQMVGNNSDWGNLAIKVEGDRLAVLRDRQVPWMREMEIELWVMTCDLLRGSTHRHARLLPPGDEVRDALRVRFPDLASAADLKATIEAMQAGLPFGITSATGTMMQRTPELTRAAATEEREENLADYIKTIEPLVNRNIPAEAPEAHGAQTIAQKQGRAGGKASGVVRSENT